VIEEKKSVSAAGAMSSPVVSTKVKVAGAQAAS
jgi:hypothetical protein